MQKAAGARLDRLTSLRFFAAFAVVITHVTVLTGKLHLYLFTARGAAGVTFFFMLSGFVLTWSHRPADSKGRFWRRRFARVYPLHLLTWGIALAIIYGIDRSQQSIAETVSSLFLVHAWTPDSSFWGASNGVSWTLSDEAFFYLAFPWLWTWLTALSDRSRWTVVAASTLVTALLMIAAVPLNARNGEWVIGVFPLTQLGQFVIGMILAMELLNGWRPNITTPVVVGSLVVGFILAEVIPNPAWRVFPLLIPFAIIIVAAVEWDLADRPGWLRHPVLVRLGVWSFALYMCHELLVYLIGHYAFGHLDFATGTLTAAGIAIVAVGMSGVLHEFVERPMEALLRGAPPRAELETEIGPMPDTTTATAGS